MRIRWLKALVVAIVFAGFDGVGAEELPPGTPPQRVPQVPEKQTAPSELPKQPKPEQAEPADLETLIMPELKGLIIVKSPDEVHREGVPTVTGLEVRDIALLNGDDFGRLVAPYFGKPVKLKTVKDLQHEIILFCRAKNRPLVDVIVPEQKIENGVLQMLFLEGRLGKIKVSNPGGKWFSDALIKEQMRSRQGEPLDSRTLLEDLDWLNRNPFLQVDVLFRQGQQLGQADLDLQVQDRFPVRPYVGYENTGTRSTGEDQLVTGINWGNAFGLDQQINYQYTTDLDFDQMEAHSGSYVIPLPWRHILTAFGSYVDVRPDLSSLSTNFSEHGISSEAGVRYAIPLPRIDKYRQELSAGFDFKRSNNNLEFGGSTVSATETHVLQFEAGYSGVLPDPWGQTSFGGELYYSPGDLSDGNNDAHFQALRSGAKADYIYARFTGERMTRLPYDFSWVVKAWGQLADERLLPSEELGFGGYATIRGYEEHEVNGDEGWIVSNELRTPPISLAKLSGMKKADDQLQFLGFWDYGAAHIKHAQLGEDPNVELSSVGVGLRYALLTNLSVRFDYGWQLKDSGSGDPHNSRAHVAVLLSF